MTEWKEMTTADAKIQLSKWDAMSHDEFDSLMNNFHPAVNSEFYCSIREHLISKWHELNQSNNNSKYYIDLHFGKELFSLLNSPKYGLTPRIASNDQVWIYLSIEVIPDIIASRYRKEDADSSTDEDPPAVIKNVNRTRFLSKRRIYPKTLWWYFYLSLQNDSSGNPDLDATEKILSLNTTDEIVQLVERAGTRGYRPELYRQIMLYYYQHRENNTSDNQYEKFCTTEIFRKVMVLNTAKLSLMEPMLCLGGYKGYTEELFGYFNGQKSSRGY